MTPPTPDLLWRRVGAAALDLAFGLAVWLVLTVVLGVLLGEVGVVLAALAALAGGVAVHGVAQGRSGATPGKALVGLRCVGPDGQPPGVKAGVVRTAAWVLDGFPYVVPGLAGFAMLMSTDDETRVGDRLAGTHVIDARSAARTHARARDAAVAALPETDRPALGPGQPVYDGELGAFVHWDPLTGERRAFDEGARTWVPVEKQADA